MNEVQKNRTEQSRNHCKVYFRDDFMGDPKHEFAIEMYEDGFDAGLQHAIFMLKNVGPENGGITNCIHAIEWATYLESEAKK